MLSLEMPAKMATGSRGANSLHEMETLHVDVTNRIGMEAMAPVARATSAYAQDISGATVSLSIILNAATTLRMNSMNN